MNELLPGIIVAAAGYSIILACLSAIIGFRWGWRTSERRHRKAPEYVEFH